MQATGGIAGCDAFPPTLDSAATDLTDGERLLMKNGFVGAAIAAWLLAGSANAANPLLGEVELNPASRVERNAGLWLDGQYVGFVKDLEGNGKLVLLPGEHKLVFKLIGYDDLTSTIVVEPSSRKRYRVAMLPKPDATYPDEGDTAQLRVSVKPEEAAIFVNDSYVGHIDQFDGHRGMRLAAGTYRLTIALPGYEAFNTELTVRAGQSYEIKTSLPKGNLDERAAALITSTADTRQ